jgi:hypothetical protein
VVVRVSRDGGDTFGPAAKARMPLPSVGARRVLVREAVLE